MSSHTQAFRNIRPGLCRISLLACVLLTACSSNPEKPQQDVFSVLEKADKAYSRGEWLNAELAYQELTERVPDDAYAWLRLGNVRLQQGRLEAAVVAYQTSLQQDQEQAKPYYNLATIYMLKAQQALQQAQRNMLPLDPGQQLVAERLSRLEALFYRGIAEGMSPGQGLRNQSQPKSKEKHSIRWE